MQSQKKIIEFYQDLGIDEIIDESPINRFETKPQIKLETAPIEENIIPKINPIKIENKKNIISDNFINMTQSQAITRLAQKQNNEAVIPINSIADIIGQAQDIADKIDNLEDLQKAVRDFNGCTLKKMATNTVFKDGDEKSPIMIIGEAPGNDEDLQGIPFCGEIGQLLNAMFEAIKYPREKLYITNSLFWRPPGNRKPTNDELAICKPFVKKHIELISPKIIILMGSVAMKGMLDIQDPISSMRGKILDYENKYLSKPIKAITLFHPSYLIKQPSKKRLAWQDLQKIEKFLKNE